MFDLTVKDLIKLLSKAPQDLKVDLEGCDCWNQCCGVSIIEADLNKYPSSTYRQCVLLRCDTFPISKEEKIE